MASRRRPMPIFSTAMDNVMPLEKLTVRQQVDRYLTRLRRSLPFPISADDCYFGCLPDTVKQLESKGVFASKLVPGRAGNMLLTMHQAAHAMTPLDNILHISAESKQGYSDAMKGTRGHERIFWIEICGTYPAPRSSTDNPFFLPPEHPQYTAIQGWISKAYAIEASIERDLKAIEHFARGGLEPAVAAKLWPDLGNFLAWPKGVEKGIRESVRHRAEKSLTGLTRSRVTDNLAKATMLPEVSPPLQAWVNFYTKEL